MKCRNMNEEYAACDEFICSECGIHLTDWIRVEIDDNNCISCFEYEFRYCPNCGSEVEA